MPPDSAKNPALAANATLAASPGSGRRRADRPVACVLGIDPGLQRTGYAVLADDGAGGSLREAGLVRLNARQPLERRLAELAESVAELVASHRPTALVCEALYAHYRHPRTAILMGHARGVILAEAGRAGIPALSVSATQVKKTLTGSGQATKPQVQRAVSRTLRLSRALSPFDVADAVAVALCGLHLGRARLGPVSRGLCATGMARKPACGVGVPR